MSNTNPLTMIFNSSKGLTEGILNHYAEAIISNINIILLDRKCKVTWVNEKFCHLMRFQAYDLINKSFKELDLIQIDAEAYTDIINTILKGIKWSGEVPCRTKDETIVWLRIQILPIRDFRHEIESFLVLCSNITPTKNALDAKKKAMEHLMHSEARYRAVVENQSDLISVCSADGTRTFVNSKYCEFMGKTSDELIGTNILQLTLGGLPPDTVKPVFQLTQDHPQISNVFELQHASGTKVWVLISINGIFDENGKLFELLTIGRDVTDLKTAELQKSAYIQDLESIAFMASHKVRAPIATMMGLAELLRLNAIGSDQWEATWCSFKKCLTDLDVYTKELGNFIYQSHRMRSEKGND